MSKYPRIGTIHEVYPKGICIFCGDPKSNRRIYVQVNWMSSDDEVFKAHAKCIKAIHKENLLLSLGYDDGFQQAAYDHFDDTVPNAGDLNQAIGIVVDAFEETKKQTWQAACIYKQKRIAELRKALGVMLDYYWGYRKNDGAWELTDDIAQKYQDELIEGGADD